MHQIKPKGSCNKIELASNHLKFDITTRGWHILSISYDGKICKVPNYCRSGILGIKVSWYEWIKSLKLNFGRHILPRKTLIEQDPCPTIWFGFSCLLAICMKSFHKSCSSYLLITPKLSVFGYIMCMSRQMRTICC